MDEVKEEELDHQILNNYDSKKENFSFAENEDIQPITTTTTQSKVLDDDELSKVIHVNDVYYHTSDKQQLQKPSQIS